MFETGKSSDAAGQSRPLESGRADIPCEAAIAHYDLEERKLLLKLARQSLERVLSTGGEAPDLDLAVLTPRLREKRACFVTLMNAGILRGCVGHIHAVEPLCQAVAHNAREAALRDPRFSPVKPDELPGLRIEISVLSELQPLAFSSPEDLLNKLTPKQDGVLLKIGYRIATFLPQVWAHVPKKDEFLNQLAEKAGCPASAWRGPETSVSIYTAESFEEE